MNIFLIGYRGSGKTTLGKILSEKLKMKFVDTDELIVERENKTIPEIFSKLGEKYFREIETKVLQDVIKNDNQVISTGGGIILSELNRNLIKNNGVCIYLKVDPKISYQRIYNDKNRPPLTNLSPLEEIIYVMNYRSKFYQETAHLTIDTGILNIEQCIEEILKFLNINYKLIT